jgi:hypothetical protein
LACVIPVCFQAAWQVWEPNNSSPSMWSTWVQNFAVLGIFVIALLSTQSFWSVGLNIRQPLVGVFPSLDRCLIDCLWDIDEISWLKWMLWWNHPQWRHIDHCCDCRIAEAICCEIFLQDTRRHIGKLGITKILYAYKTWWERRILGWYKMPSKIQRIVKIEDIN